MNIPSLAIKVLQKNIANFPKINNANKIALGALGLDALYALANALYEPDPLDSFPLPITTPSEYGLPSNTSLGQSTTVPTSPPSTLPNRTVVVPPVVPYVKPYMDNAVSISEQTDVFLKGVQADSLARDASISSQNAEQLEKAGAGLFLQNMALSKSSIDEISFALNAQSAVFAMIYNTLETHLSILSGVALQNLVIENASPARVSQGTAVAYPPIDYTAHIERLTEGILPLATISDRLEPLEDNEKHKRTPIAHPDVSTVSGVGALAPRDVAHAKNFELARGEADTNRIAPSDLDWIDSLLDDMDITGDMFKPYVRMDTILNHVKNTAEGDGETWESLMEDLYR